MRLGNQLHHRSLSIALRAQHRRALPPSAARRASIYPVGNIFTRRFLKFRRECSAGQPSTHDGRSSTSASVRLDGATSCTIALLHQGAVVVKRLNIIAGLAVALLIGGSAMFLGKTPASDAGRPTPAQCPSVATVPTQSIGGQIYRLAGLDTFTNAAPLGSFASGSPDRIVYRGDHGMAWTVYPDGWPSTYSASGAEGYQPSTVLSVHNGVLDFHLHNDSHGHPVGADPSPQPGGKQYQTYGAWSFCERVAPADSHRLDDFHQAPLLWPRNPSKWQWAESDYPEDDLSAYDFSSYSHYGGSGAQDVFNIQTVESSYDPTQWHVYTQTWGPGFRAYYVDGRLVGTSTNEVWSGPERWQMQVEPSGRNDGDSGHVYVKWVWIGTGPVIRSTRRHHRPGAAGVK